MGNKNEVLIYEDKDGLTRVDVKFIDEDVWLTKYQLARNSCKFKKRVIEKSKETLTIII